MSNSFRLANPDWSAAVKELRYIPKAARVGVLLKLTARNGFGSIDACTVALASDDARLNEATCNALKASNYSEYLGRAYSSTNNPSDAYPVLVQWHGENAEMTAPSMPTVPHMPKDVPLSAGDVPTGEPPVLRVIPIRINLDADGHGIGCTVMQTSGSDAWDAASCRIALERAHFSVPRDWFGRPARGIYEAMADWTAMTVHPAH